MPFVSLLEIASGRAKEVLVQIASICDATDVPCVVVFLNTDCHELKMVAYFAKIKLKH